MKKVILAAVTALGLAASCAMAATQQEYESLLHARYDMFVQRFETAKKQAREAAERGDHDAVYYRFIEDAREAWRGAEEMDRMWLESQKP